MTTTTIETKREVHPFTTEEAWLRLRAKDITSTDVAALFGISPYKTAFELWHEKREQMIVSIGKNERSEWGKRLQDPIAKGLLEDNREKGWESVAPLTDYIRDPERRMAASFDNTVVIKGRTGILEIKNVDLFAFKDGWTDEGEGIEALPHIEIQVQQQLYVSGLEFAVIGVLVGGNRGVTLYRELDEKIIAGIQQKVAAFWKSQEENRPPDPDFKRDADFIRQLYRSAKSGSVLDVKEDPEFRNLALRYELATKLEKEQKEVKEAIKAEMLFKMKDSEQVKGEDFSISAGMVETKAYKVDAKSYRGFRLTFKKEKGEKA